MKPESLAYLKAADDFLADAFRVLQAGFEEIAVRESYLAALNAARAAIFEFTDKTTKTHTGTRAEFLKIIHDGTLAFDPEVAQFLTEGFDIKMNVDYGPRTPIAPDEAAR